MLVNHKEAGEHYGSKQATGDTLATTMQPSYLSFPPTSLKHLPCWNFHLDQELVDVAKAFCNFTSHQLAKTRKPKPQQEKRE